MALKVVSDGQGGALLGVKAVPGASRDSIAGVLGERLKVRISAPAEGGKANKAICELIAASLGLKSREVEIVAGHSSPEKQVRIHGATVEQVSAFGEQA